MDDTLNDWITRPYFRVFPNLDGKVKPSDW